MKSAHHHLDAGGAKRPSDVETTRVLVSLNAHQRQQVEISMPAETSDQLRYVDAGIRLIDRIDVDFNVGAEHLPLRCVDRQAVDGGQRI